MRLKKVLLVLLILMGTGSAFAAGSGHDHDEPSSTTQEAQPSADQDDAKHDEVVEESADHHGPEQPMNAHSDSAMGADDHHGDTAMEEMAAEHDHSTHEEGTWAKDDFQQVLAWIGKFHPAATNFPIALLLAAALAELLFLGTQNTALRQAARFCLWTGTAGAVGTAVLGWFFVGFDFSADDALLSAHRWNGTATAFVSLFALGFGERAFAARGSVALFRVALVAVALMAGYNGLLGGKMVYGEDHYAWPTSE